MEFACELLHTSKAFHTMVCKRLEIICHEDIDTMPQPLDRAVRQGRARAVERVVTGKSIGEARLMDRQRHPLDVPSAKSREG